MRSWNHLVYTILQWKPLSGEGEDKFKDLVWPFILLGHNLLWIEQSHHRMFTCNSCTDGLLIFKESTAKGTGKAGKKADKAKSDKPSTAKSGQKSDKKVRI